MIKHTVEIDNYGDYCGKCKLRWCLNPYSKIEMDYICSLFHKKLRRTLGGRKLCRCDECIKLEAQEEEK